MARSAPPSCDFFRLGLLADRLRPLRRRARVWERKCLWVDGDGFDVRGCSRPVAQVTRREQPRTSYPSPSTHKHFLSQTLARRRRGRSLSASKPNRKKSHEGGAERAITVKALHDGRWFSGKSNDNLLKLLVRLQESN